MYLFLWLVVLIGESIYLTNLVFFKIPFYLFIT